MQERQNGQGVAGGGNTRSDILCHNFSFERIISVDNLLLAWQEFVKGKRNKRDVQEFGLHLMDNLVELHSELANKSYKHGPYKAFKINDPKPRDIHKASVRDRLLHHAIHRVLYPYFDRKFIADSFSCRVGKGTHKALDRFRAFAYKVSKNHTRTVWVLKCDIRKFFASINHAILKQILAKHLADKNTLWLMGNVIESFHTTPTGMIYHTNKAGLPLGNLTSQLLANVYLNELDQFMKHKLKVKYHIRYADDFVILSPNKGALTNLVPMIDWFLLEHLKLILHPDKLFLKTFASGIDFLGWVHFRNHRILRTATKRRMFRNLAARQLSEAMLNSYVGLLSHGNARKLALSISRDSGIMAR